MAPKDVKREKRIGTTLVTFLLLFIVTNCIFSKNCVFVFSIESDLISSRLIIFSWYFRIYSNSNYGDSLHILRKENCYSILTKRRMLIGMRF